MKKVVLLLHVDCGGVYGSSQGTEYRFNVPTPGAFSIQAKELFTARTRERCGMNEGSRSELLLCKNLVVFSWSKVFDSFKL